MAWTKTAIIFGAAVLVAGSTWLLEVKVSGPQLKDSDFFVGEKSPPNLAVIRPTHFAHSDTQMEGVAFKNAAGKYVRYMVGRNVSVREMIGDAYGNQTQIVNEARIVFPAAMPTNKFDYLVTPPDDPEAHLQAAIKKQLGYSAHWETHHVDILALKVETPNAPGLQISTNSVRGYKHWRLTHHQIGIVARTLEYDFKQPVLDETGLTNFYDFYWSFVPTNQFQINDLLANLGLGLEATNEPVQMLIVEKAR